MLNRLRVPLAATGKCYRNSSGIMMGRSKKEKSAATHFGVSNGEQLWYFNHVIMHYWHSKIYKSKIYYYTNRLSNILCNNYIPK